MPADRKRSFLLALFTPDNVYTNVGSNELLISGEGSTVRVPLDVFIKLVDWPTLATHYNVWRTEQDRIRKEKWDERSNRESLDLSSDSPVHNN